MTNNSGTISRAENRPEASFEEYEFICQLLLLIVQIIKNMFRILLVVCVFNVVGHDCQQPLAPLPPLIMNLLAAIERINLKVPEPDEMPLIRRKRLEVNVQDRKPFNVDVPAENKPRRKREDEEDWSAPFCGATAMRLNITLEKTYGVWFPVQASKMAYMLWVTSLYGEDGTAGVICPTWNIQPGKEMNTISIEVTHKEKAILLEGFLLGEGFNSKSSKWVVSWPNGEDTLTSVVAVGGQEGSDGNYNWMLTVDCDLNGVVSSDWAVFSRKPTMAPENLSSIIAIAHGIQGLQTKHVTKTSEVCEV